MDSMCAHRYMSHPKKEIQVSPKVSTYIELKADDRLNAHV